MSRTWFTSDPHFRHATVAQRHRGFASVLEHDERIAREWRRAVGPDDEVFVLGDLAISDWGSVLDLIGGLPGVKHLVSGNHDPTHPMHRRAFRHQRKFLQVFESVSQTATIKIAGERVTLSHFPFTADHTDPPRHMAWRPQDSGQWLLHGHTHSQARLTSPREIHVGVDAWSFAPVPEGAIVRMMEGRPP